MADEKVEPIVEPKAEKAEIDIDGIIAELEKAGATDPEKIAGMSAASKEAGHLANLLGTEKRKTEALNEKLDKLITQKQTPSDEFYNENPVDLEATIARTLANELNKRDDAQRQAHQAANETFKAIRADGDYHLVKEIWEAKERDPAYAGVNPQEEYHATVREFYKGMLTKSAKTIQQLTGNTKVTPPHMEGNQSTPDFKPDLTDGQEKIKDYQDKVNKGHSMTEEQSLDALDTVLGNFMA